MKHVLRWFILWIERAACIGRDDWQALQPSRVGVDQELIGQGSPGTVEHARVDSDTVAIIRGVAPGDDERTIVANHYISSNYQINRN